MIESKIVVAEEGKDMKKETEGMTSSCLLAQLLRSPLSLQESFCNPSAPSAMFN